MADMIQGLSIGLSLDTAGITPGLKDLKRELKAVDSEMKVNMSAFGRSEKSVQKYETQLTGLNRKLEVQQAAVNEARREQELMVQQHGEGSRQAQIAGQAYNNLAADFNNLQRYTQETREEFENFRREQEIAESTFGRLGDSLEENGGKMTKFGDGMKTVGSGMSAAITAPVVGLGAAAIATAIEFDDAQGRIQSGLGVTSDRAAELEGVAKSLWENGFTGNVNDAADAIVTVSKNLTDLPTAELEKITGYAGILADRFEIDIAQSTNAAGMVVEAFGGTAAEAFDLMTYGLQNAKGDGGELLDVFNEYAPQFAALGYTAEGFMATLVEGSQTGAFNFDLLGDAVKESFLLVGEGSDDVKDTLKDLGLDADQVISGINGGGEEAQKSFMAVSAAIAGVKDPTEKTAATIALFGTPIEDLGPQFQGFFSGVEQDLVGVEGATQRAGDALYDNFGAKMTGVFRDFQADLLPAGEILLEMAEDWLPKIADSVGSVTGKFAELDPKGQKAVIAIAGIAAAAGPVIVGLGFVASAIGGIMTAAAPLSVAIAGAGGLSASFGIAGTAVMAFATGPVGIAIAAIAGIGIGVGLLVNHFRKDAIPEVDRFGDKVSEKTKQALGGFFELSDGASQSLMDMRINGTEVTSEMAADLVGTYDEMNTKIINGMLQRHNQELEDMDDFFMSSSALTSAEEEKIVQQTAIRQQGREVAQQHFQDRIKQIIETAATEKRALTESEATQINEIQKQMNDSAVVYLSENEMEQKIILERMAATSGEMSALQAAEVVKNSAESRDKVIADANTKYDDVVAMAIRERDETGTITAEQATKIIAEATKTKDSAVKNAEDMHSGVVDEARLQAGEHIEQVDWETGEILSKWDVYKAGVLQKFTETNEESLADFKRWGINFDEAWTEFNGKAQVKADNWKTGVKKRFTSFFSDTRGDFSAWGTNFDEGWTSFDTKARGKVDSWKTGVKQRFTGFFSDTKSDFSKWGSDFDSGWNSFNEKARAKADSYKSGIVSRFKSTNSESLADFKRWGSNLKGWAGDAKDGIMRTFDSLVTGAKNLPGRIGSGISSMASKVSDGVKSVSNKLASGLGTGVNGVIGGINWVLGKIGVESKVPKWEVPKYAMGTHAHPGGLAVLGDGHGSNAGRELIKTPSGELGLSPASDTLMNLPKGTEVLSAKKTRELLGDVPKYANGIGDLLGGLWNGEKSLGGKAKDAAFNVWDHVSNPGKLLSTALSLLGISAPKDGSFVGNMAKGGYNKVKSSAAGFLKGKIDSSGMQAGSGQGFGPGFRLTSRRGFRINPVTGLGQMHQGDDWGARQGALIAAQAAGKVIEAGFHGIRGNYVRIKSGIMDRLYQHNQRNMVSVGQNVRKGQAVGTVGSTGRSTGPHLHYEVRRNGINIDPAGLATGGLTNKEQFVRISEGDREEITIPMHKSRRTDAMKLLALAGKKLMPGGDKGITRPNQIPNVSGGSNDGDVLKALLAATMKQNEILMQLLNKDSNLYVDSAALVGTIGEPMNEKLGNSSKRNAYLSGVR